MVDKSIKLGKAFFCLLRKDGAARVFCVILIGAFSLGGTVAIAERSFADIKRDIAASKQRDDKQDVAMNEAQAAQREVNEKMLEELAWIKGYLKQNLTRVK